MNKGIKRSLLVLAASVFVLGACGIDNKENSEKIEVTQESETEQIEIIDAEDILVKIWDTYEQEERFDIMGGHFTTAAIGMPAKYDLTQATDLVQMYCVPERQLAVIDDAATMIDFYNAARFTAGAYHVLEKEAVETVAEQMRLQVLDNQWHGENPEKLFIVKIEEQYVISVYGREPLVDEFKQKLANVYGKVVTIMIEEKLF